MFLKGKRKGTSWARFGLLVKIGNTNSKLKGSSKTLPLTQTMPFCRETRGSPWVLSVAEVGNPRHTGAGQEVGHILPPALRLHHSKKEEQGGHMGPRKLLEAVKDEFPFFQMGKRDHLTETKGFGDFSFFRKRKCGLLSLQHWVFELSQQKHPCFFSHSSCYFSYSAQRNVN